MALRSRLRVCLRSSPPHQLPGPAPRQARDAERCHAEHFRRLLGLYVAGGDCLDERVHKAVDQLVDRQCGNPALPKLTVRPIVRRYRG